MSKYHARKVVIDGYTFDSQAEGRRYNELKMLEGAGEIGDLAIHPRYPLVVNGVKVADYIGDFAYWDQKTWVNVTEDVKGVRTPVYRLKKKLVKALYDIDITEVEA